MNAQKSIVDADDSASSNLVSSNDYNQVYVWLSAARNHPAGSRERNRYLTQIIREISPQLWRTNTPYYADALQQTWIYFVKHVCTTYDRDRGCLVRWLNATLWYRHQDLARQALNRHYREIPIDSAAADSDSRTQVVLDIPAREYGSLAWLQQVTQWVQADPDAILRRTHMRNRPELNCQTLILLRLPPETSWKTISVQFNVPVPTLSSFYRRKCLPLLREFGQAEGIL